MSAQNHNRFSCAKPADTGLSAGRDINGLFFTLLFILYVFLSLISFIWDMDGLIKINMAIGWVALMIFSFKVRRKRVPIYVLTGLIFAAFLISSLCVDRTGWRLFTPVLFIISGVGAAMILLSGYVRVWGGYVIFYSLAGYFLALMLTGVPGGSALKYCSFNGISTAMLVACISFYIVSSMQNKKLDIKPALLTLLISIWGIGRSGIISSSVLLAGLLYIRIKNKPRYGYYVIAGLVAAFLLLYATDFSFFKNVIGHFAERGGVLVNDARSTMWANYFNNLDISRVMFGVNVVEDPWPAGKLNEYNYHSSFINLHLQTGFMGLIVMALITFAIFKFYRTHKVFFFLFLTLILRASTDSFLFFGRFDFVPFFFIFYFLAPGRSGSQQINGWDSSK